jgi:hypothetical protein
LMPVDWPPSLCQSASGSASGASGKIYCPGRKSARRYSQYREIVRRLASGKDGAFGIREVGNGQITSLSPTTAALYNLPTVEYRPVGQRELDSVCGRRQPESLLS